MATKINVDINVSDNGTAKKSTEAAERLKKTYDAAAKSASKIGGSPTMAGAASRTSSSAELVEYNRNRALSTGTGASARDFAKQAEGLGGLVRLYATFAANVFAVSAAFGALSSAMDTTNMIRGLDQLGSATGVNLGGLSKRLVETTGHAVSLREAMEATVKASAAGIDSSSILRLGKVAQQASVALGVNASDALNRLSRGVVKLEPELLDELGIFTKIDPAVKKYAESVNKAVSELTDFERRQAFLNAVIEEGEQKFSQIEIDTNPYTKLSAALQNTLQNALELVNKGLGPIANFLAESPGALTAALVGLGTVLVKQALPALGQVREGLRKTAEEAAEAASGKAGEAVQARGILQDLLVKQVQRATDEQIQIVDESEKKILELKNGRISKQSALYVLMKKDIQDVEDSDIQAAKNQLARMGNRTEAQKALRAETANYIDQIEKLRVATDKEFVQGKKQLESTYIYRKVQEDALKFEIKAKQDSMVSNAAYTSSLLGPTAGWRRLRAEIELADISLNKFQRSVLLARGALAILGSAIASVADKIGKLFFYIGIVTTAWTALSSLFTSSESQKLSSSFDELNSTLENVEKTFKRVKDSFSEAGLTAQANALTEFSKSIDESATATRDALSSLNTGGYFSGASIGNRIAGFLPFIDTKEEEIADQLSASIVASVSVAAEKLPQNLGEDLRAKVFTGIFDFDSSEITLGDEKGRAKVLDRLKAEIKALAEAGDSGVELSRRLLAVAEAYNIVALNANNAASRIREVKEASREATNTFNTFVDSYKVKSPLIEFAEKSITVLKKLDTAQKEALKIGDPKAGAEATKAAEDFLKSVGLDPGTASDISSGLSYFTGILTRALAVEKNKAQNAFKDFALSLAPGFSASQLQLETQAAKAKLDELKAEKEQIDKIDKIDPNKLGPAAKQGIETKIQAANNAVLIAQTKELLASEKERANNLNRISARQKNSLDTEKALIELSFLNGARTEQSLIKEQGRLKISEANLEKTRKLDELLSKEKTTLIQVEALRKAGENVAANQLENESRAEIVSERAKANAEGALAVKKAQVNTDLQLLDIAVRIAQQVETTKRLTEETERIKAQSGLAGREAELDVQTRTNKLSRDALLSTTKKLALDKITQKETEELQNAGATLVENQLTLGQRLSKAFIESNEQEQQSILAQIFAQNEKYKALVDSIKGVSEASRRGAELDIQEKRTQLLQNELDLRRQIEDIVTGGTFTAQDTALNMDEQVLELKRKTLRLDQEIYITEKGAIALRRNAADFERQRLAAIQETTRQIEDSENRKKAPGVGPEAIAQETQRQIELGKALDNTLANLDQQEDSRQRSIQSATRLEQIELRNTRADAARTVLDLENQIAQVRISSIEEANSKTLEISRRRNQLGAQEIRAFETGALQASVASKAKQSLDALDTSNNATRRGLVTELAKGVETGADQAALDNINERIKRQDDLYQKEQKRIRDNAAQDLQLGLLDIQNRYNDSIKSERDLRIQINAQEVETSNIEKNYDITRQETRLEALKQIGAIEESRYLQLKNSVELEKLSLDLENRKRSVVLSRVREIQASQDRINAGGLTPEQVALEIELQNASRTGLSIALSLLKEEGNLRAGILNTTGQIAVADAKRAEDAKKLTDQYKEMADAAKLIGDVFDNFGDRFAETVGGLSSVLQTDLEKRAELEQKYQQKQRQASEKYKDSVVRLDNALFALSEQKKKDELKLDMELNTKAISNTKGLFKEKSTAFKTLTALEKASAAVTLALNAQVIASNLLSLPGKIAGGVSQLFSQLGVGGFAASAAFLALMGSLGVFKGSAKGSFGPSLQQVQDAQTTGQSYQNGVLTTNRGALSADPTKTLESIDQSLELLKTYGFDELEFSNKNSTVLDKIENNTKGLAEAIAVQNLGLLENAPLSFKKEGFSIGGIVGKLLGSVFGGKTTQTVKDFGVIVSGSLSTLIDANTALVQTFTDLETFRKGGWFSSDKLSVARTPLERASEEVVEYVSVLFGDVKNTFLNSAEILGSDVASVVDSYVIEPFEISTKDLKPEEIVAAIKNKVSLTFNALAEQGFGALVSALRDPLEEAGTTLTRLSSQVTLFDQAMSLVSKSVGNITNTLKVVVADDLIELVGGVETFQERISFFRENFLTEAEQISPIAEALTKELEALGISGTLTRDQFKALVLSQDLTSDSGRSTFAALLNVAEAFDTVTSAAEEAQSKLDGFVKDIRDFIREQTLDLVKPSQTTQALFQEFGTTVSKSLQGDENSLSYLPDIASQTIESARNSSASLREFNKLRAGIIGSLGEVASKIESGDLKILTPQEQSNVLLEQIVDNTGSLASDLAKEIDRQAQITAAKADLLSNPEKLQAAITASVVEAGDFGSSDVPVPKATLDFLAAEERAGTRNTRMAAVEQILGLITPGASAARVVGDLIGGKSLSEALAVKTDKISLEALGIKAPSLEAIVNGISEGAKAVQTATTIIGAGVVVAVQTAKEAITSLVGAITSGSDSSSGSSISIEAQERSGTFSGDWDGPRLALGAAFNKGVKMFETGGAFTNSVISNPTMFPLGVMGEAGPEAIMPLTRTSDGSLGVQAELPRFNTQQDRTPETLVLELKELRKEMEKVRIGVETTATGTNKTFRLLDRVAQDGDSLNVVTTSNSLVSIQGIKGGSF